MHELVRDITFSIAAAWLLGLVAQQFRQPILLAHLIAGFALGPAGSGLIASTDSISAIAELGLIFLLFMIGLEIAARLAWPGGSAGVTRRKLRGAHAPSRAPIGASPIGLRQWRCRSTGGHSARRRMRHARRVPSPEKGTPRMAENCGRHGRRYTSARGPGSARLSQNTNRGNVSPL